MKNILKESMRLPCADWVQKLAARHPDDLSPTDRRALHQHLTLCATCNEVYATYRILDAQICNSTVKRPIPEISFEPFQPLRKPSAHTQTRSLHTLPLLFLTAISSFFITISWSPFFQAIHAWLLLALNRFPRRIAYASSNNRFLYVMRSDSGYFLWRHKRYRRSELVSHMPVRGSGMLFTGAGTALAAALDFCKYAVRA